MSKHMENEILTADEVARLLKTTPQTIWRWCKAGKLPAFKVGNGWRIRRADLDRTMNKNIKLVLNGNSD